MNKKEKQRILSAIVLCILAFFGTMCIYIFSAKNNDLDDVLTGSSYPKTTAASVADEAADETVPDESEASEPSSEDASYVKYHFRTETQLRQHFEKHGGEFRDDFAYETAEDYEKGASDVINSPEALYKTEAEDGDGVYYIEASNEFVILSTDGYIRTYFRPSGGLSYFERQ